MEKDENHGVTEDTERARIEKLCELLGLRYKRL